MKRIVVVFFASLALMGASLFGKDPSQHEYPIRFEIRKGFWSVEGYFSDVSTDLHFDPSSAEQTVLVGSAKVNSINTGNGMRDRHLMGAEWFDAAHHPEIQMQAVSVAKTSEGYLGTFLILIKGQHMSKELDFILDKKQENAYLTASFSINRKAFALEGSNPIMEGLLGDEVRIFLNIPFDAQPI
jgi:polyisoprenoid-binding protein YceI